MRKRIRDLIQKRSTMPKSHIQKPGLRHLGNNPRVFTIRPMVRDWIFRCDGCARLVIHGQGKVCAWCLAEERARERSA